MACQDVKGWRKYALPGEAELKTFTEHRKTEQEKLAKKTDLEGKARLARFSKKVQAGLIAAERLRAARLSVGIVSHQPVSRDLPERLGWVSHTEGAGKSIAEAIVPWERGKVDRLDEDDVGLVYKLQEKIRDALTALAMEPQPNFSLDWFWAKQTLEQGLTRIGNVFAAQRRALGHR
jgi:hypothetical protein